LGELVKREVVRWQRLTGRDQTAVRLAVEDARSVVDELRGLIARIDRDRSPSEDIRPRDDQPSVHAR